MENRNIEIGLPEKLEIYDHGSYLEIVRKWFGLHVLFFTAFAIFWDGALVFWYGSIGEDTDLMAILFPLIHVAIGIGVTYYVVAGWLNRTYIFVSQSKIAVRHRPIPWLGNKEIFATDLKQLYAKSKISKDPEGGYPSETYEVQAITHSGRNIKLVGDLDSSEQALFIEQEIEKYLNIEDVPVKGEIGGPSI